MKLQDKIIELRRRRGYSQEELAERLGVSRQAVSKWESGMSVPDIGRVIAMSELFGVSTDYLLKDDASVEGAVMQERRAAISVEQSAEEHTAAREVGLEEASDYLRFRRRAAVSIAVGAMLCVLSPIPMFFFGMMGEMGIWGLSEDAGGSIGLILLFLIVASAVALFVSTGMKHSPWEFLEKSEFRLSDDASAMVRRTREGMRASYIRTNVIGTCLCVLAPISLFVGGLFASDEKAGFVMVGLLSMMIAIVAVAVFLFVFVGVKWAATERLLGEGEFAPKTGKRALIEAIMSIYWLGVVGIYLAWSFLSRDWHISWIVWPIAACLGELASILLKYSGKKEK